MNLTFYIFYGIKTVKSNILGVDNMEIKPIKESKKNLYPTINESKKSNFIKNIVFYVAAIDITRIEPLYVAVPVYAPSYMPLKIIRLVRNVTFITTVISLFLLIKNKLKIKKDINLDEKITKKIKKHIKINRIFLIISILVMIATMIGIAILNEI